MEGKSVLLFWYRNQIYAIEARSPAEGAYSEGFIKAKFTQDFAIGEAQRGGGGKRGGARGCGMLCARLQACGARVGDQREFAPLRTHALPRPAQSAPPLARSSRSRTAPS